MMMIKLNWRRLLVAAVTFCAAWVIWIAYKDYWVPAKDMQAMGFEWVKPWTSRRIDHVNWIDGFQSVYTFTITREKENWLRSRCIVGAEPAAAKSSCYVAHGKDIGRPDIEVELQAGVIKLYYTSAL